MKEGIITVKKKENSTLHQEAKIIALFMVLVFILSMLCLYLYWQNYENRNAAKVKDDAMTQALHTLREVSATASSNSQLNIKDPTNVTLDNADIVSVDPQGNKIVFLDKTGAKLPLIVVSGSKLQKVTILPTGKASWTNVGIQGVPSGAKGTVFYNKSHEVIDLVFMVAR